jgi:hypothetical protein
MSRNKTRLNSDQPEDTKEGMSDDDEEGIDSEEEGDDASLVEEEAVEDMTDYEISKLRGKHPNSAVADKYLKEQANYLENILLVLSIYAEANEVPVPPMEHNIEDLLNNETGGFVHQDDDHIIDVCTSSVQRS